MEQNKVFRAFMQEIKDIRFTDIDDFMKKKDKIKNKVNDFDTDTKEIYKWYFYHQLCLLRQKQYELKDFAWRYIIGENVELDLSLEYRKFCKKRNHMNFSL